jgi:hypothetical protein
VAPPSFIPDVSSSTHQQEVQAISNHNQRILLISSMKSAPQSFMPADLISGRGRSRRQTPPSVTSRGSANLVSFRWPIENWQPGPFKQYPFQFSHESKYLLKNHQPIESTRFELALRSMDALTSEKTWYLDAVLQHAFDHQKPCAVYSRLLISPEYSEARFITPVSLSEIDSFVFANNTLYVDIRIADSPLTLAGIPALASSSVPSAHNILPFAGLQNASCGLYANGIIQTLFHLPAFRAAVYATHEGSSLVREMQRQFGGLEVPSRASAPRLLLKAFGWNQTDILLHHDASDFVRFFLGKLSESYGDSTIHDLFATKFTQTTRTTDFLAPRVDSILMLALDEHESGSLDDALSTLFIPEIRDQFFQGRSDIPINSEILDFPPVLIIHLRRFELNRLTGKREKNSEPFSSKRDGRNTTTLFVFSLFSGQLSRLSLF